MFGYLILWVRNKIRGDTFIHNLAKNLFKVDDQSMKGKNTSN